MQPLSTMTPSLEGYLVETSKKATGSFLDGAGRADGVSFAHLLLWQHIPRVSIIMKFYPDLEVLCSEVSLLNLDLSLTHSLYPRSARTLRLWNFTCQVSGKEMCGFLWICHLPSNVTFSNKCLGLVSGGGQSRFKNYICFTWEHSTNPTLNWTKQHWRASLQLKHNTAISSNIFHLFHKALHAELDITLSII